MHSALNTTFSTRPKSPVMATSFGSSILHWPNNSNTSMLLGSNQQLACINSCHIFAISLAKFIYPTCIQSPIGGDAIWILQRRLILGKTRMTGLPYADTLPKCDRQTDRQTDKVTLADTAYFKMLHNDVSKFTNYKTDVNKKEKFLTLHIKCTLTIILSQSIIAMIFFCLWHNPPKHTINMNDISNRSPVE